MTDPRAWHKSSYSGGQGSCVEVAEGDTVLVRDTRHRDLGHIAYPPQAWVAFVSDLRRGGVHD
ncbi:uncharacterized protein DUF397 [Murinocardiopsis flavida]|uniref:Uncharacterized protein DUF397 n=1 Tax=Murinocardiopsis flavida TaxID=645275 RepID=A0A2P8D903_9ACTN|nr:DUF397 domain-containing protein [Murinocardiopsis flavida]PSK93708.1 uncharacterized protein DUF397 [Murinocardiopsis flavida]